MSSSGPDERDFGLLHVGGSGVEFGEMVSGEVLVLSVHLESQHHLTYVVGFNVGLVICNIESHFFLITCHLDNAHFVLVDVLVGEVVYLMIFEVQRRQSDEYDLSFRIGNYHVGILLETDHTRNDHHILLVFSMEGVTPIGVPSLHIPSTYYARVAPHQNHLVELIVTNTAEQSFSHHDAPQQNALVQVYVIEYLDVEVQSYCHDHLLALKVYHMAYLSIVFL